VRRNGHGALPGAKDWAGTSLAVIDAELQLQRPPEIVEHLRGWRHRLTRAIELVAVPASAAERAHRTGARVCLAEAPPAGVLAASFRRFASASAAEAAVIVNREIFGRLCTAAMLPTVDEACRTWRPAAILHEAAEFAGPIAADRYGIPHIQVAISRADVEAASLKLAAPVLEPYGWQ